MHTLLFYPSWAVEKISLFERLGFDIFDRTYGSIVRAAMCSAACWTALVDFCHVQEGVDRVGALGPKKAKGSFNSGLSGV